MPISKTYLFYYTIRMSFNTLISGTKKTSRPSRRAATLENNDGNKFVIKVFKNVYGSI